MDEDKLIAQQRERVLKRFRFLGWGFLIIGSVIFIGFLSATLDPKAKITINQVDTYDFASKAGATAFAAIFPIIGALLALLPERVILPLIQRGVKQAYDRVPKFLKK
ncbi:MAG: hypothetical protein QM790_05890 [Nibricoccus sp.]